jgi:hypothetical protein
MTFVDANIYNQYVYILFRTSSPSGVGYSVSYTYQRYDMVTGDTTETNIGSISISSPMDGSYHRLKNAKVVPKVNGGFLWGQIYTASDDSASVGDEDQVGIAYGSESSCSNEVLWTKAAADHTLFYGTDQVRFAGQYIGTTYLAATLTYSVYQSGVPITFIEKIVTYMWMDQTGGLTVDETSIGEAEPPADYIKNIIPLTSKGANYGYYITDTPDDGITEYTELYIMDIQNNTKVATIDASSLGFARIFPANYVKVSEVPLSDNDDTIFIEGYLEASPGDYRWRIIEVDVAGNFIRYLSDYETVNTTLNRLTGHDLTIANGLLCERYARVITTPLNRATFIAANYLYPINPDTIRA